MSRTGQTLMRGATVRLGSLGISLGLQMAMLPFILHHLGDHLYGVWVVIGTLSSYYGLLDLGLSSAVTRFVSRELGRGDHAAASNYAAAGCRVFCLLGGFVILLSVLVAIGGSQLIHQAEDRRLFCWIALIVGCGLGLSFPTRAFDGVLVAHLRFDLLAVVRVVFSLVRAGLIYVLLTARGSILGLALINSLVSLAEGLSTVGLARRVHGPLGSSWTVAQKGILKEMFGYASYSCIAQVTDLLRFKLHPIIITVFMRFADVTPYAIADRLQNVVVDICSAILSMLTPVFSRQEAQGNLEAMRRSFFLAYKISCYLGVLLLGLLSICAADFIARWLGPGHDLVLTLLYLRVGGSLCGISQMPVVNLLFGTSENRFYAFSNALHAALTLILSIILIRPFGLPGVVLAVVSVTAFVKLFIQAWAACRVLKETLWSFHLGHTVPNLARPLPFLAAAWFLARLLLAPGYVRVGRFSAGVLALFVPYILFVGFSKSERELFLRSLVRCLTAS